MQNEAHYNICIGKRFYIICRTRVQSKQLDSHMQWQAPGLSPHVEVKG